MGQIPTHTIAVLYPFGVYLFFNIASDVRILAYSDSCHDLSVCIVSFLSMQLDNISLVI